jgi:cob(I)alamin adenosyltransferase
VKIIYYTQRRTGFMGEKGLGLIHIYYGQGVGKTSRAVGMAIRAAGEGLQVDFVQFMKSGKSGEVAIFEKIHNIRYRCPGEHPFVMSRGPDAVHYKHAEKALRYALEAVERATDLLICDEMLDTVIFKLLQEEQLLELMERCRNKVELVLTGRDASQQVIKSADYATELVQIKHAYYSGARARKGIEY